MRGLTGNQECISGRLREPITMQLLVSSLPLVVAQGVLYLLLSVDNKKLTLIFKELHRTVPRRSGRRWLSFVVSQVQVGVVVNRKDLPGGKEFRRSATRLHERKSRLSKS